jgi:hypothetical protein
MRPAIFYRKCIMRQDFRNFVVTLFAHCNEASHRRHVRILNGGAVIRCHRASITDPKRSITLP